MSSKEARQSIILVLLIPLVVIGFRASTLFHHAAWNNGRATVTGHVDDIEATSKVRVIKYSYAVGGQSYTGDVTDRNKFDSGTPVEVTYATSDPSVSTILPDEIESGFHISVAVSIASLLPALGLLISRLVARKKS